MWVLIGRLLLLLLLLAAATDGNNARLECCNASKIFTAEADDVDDVRAVADHANDNGETTLGNAA